MVPFNTNKEKVRSEEESEYVVDSDTEIPKTFIEKETWAEVLENKGIISGQRSKDVLWLISS